MGCLLVNLSVRVLGNVKLILMSEDADRLSDGLVYSKKAQCHTFNEGLKLGSCCIEEVNRVPTYSNIIHVIDSVPERFEFMFLFLRELAGSSELL